MAYFVYILTDQKNGSLYVGVTGDLQRRVYSHKEKYVDGFTKKYDVNRLVYFEMTDNVLSAIQREKQIKKWNRDWKIALIEKTNPEWKDLYETL
ncbi:MAG TPA: GIY-YIG nuclease family protein [Elusimicrobiota bacterium]|nr:GIY-YIG nuclease family protein [Elusimicrobiota bacterium]